MKLINEQNEKHKTKLPKILIIFPLIAAVSYLLYLADLITFLMSSVIGTLSFVILALLLIVLARKEKLKQGNIRKETRTFSLLIVIASLVILLISISLFVGLNNQSDVTNGGYKKDDNLDFDKFIGTWEGFWTTITFSVDGRISYEMYSGTWELKNGKLITYMSGEYAPEEKITYDYIFSNNNQTLTLTDDEGAVNIYTKI